MPLKIRTLFLRQCNPKINFIASKACIEPITPAIAPRIPNVFDVNSTEGFIGYIHWKQLVFSFGTITVKIPSNSHTAPHTNGTEFL